MKYQSDKSYPEIKVEKKNEIYASILLKDFSGMISEETAIHLYLYQSFAVGEKFKEYKEIIMHIAEVEMIHLRLLGETIQKLGGNPIYGIIGADGTMRLWNAGNVEYARDLKRMLEVNIQSEQEAISQYQNSLNIIQDIYVKQIIKRIVLDEYIHLSIFKKLYASYFDDKTK